MVFTGEYLGDDPRPVRFRVNSEPATEFENWMIHGDGTSVRVRFSQTPEFIAQIHSAERLVVQVQNWQNQSSTFQFDMTGFEEALSRLYCVEHE